MSQLTDFEWGKIIGRWEAGESICDIAGALNHSQSQVAHAIKAFKEEDRTTKKYKWISFLFNEWVGRDYLQKLVDSIPQRVQAVIDSKGNPTKY